MNPPPSHARAPLPAELTSFIGRERELAELRALLGRSRLVTLTGAAGSGKTRLALALAASESPESSAWVELAALRDPGLVVAEVAEAMGVHEELRGGDVAALGRLLQARRATLVLDNCEHLVDACAELADSLLRHGPGLSILATSREALGVPGERAWLVPPLSLPDDDEDPAAFEAVRLFVERARDVSPGFALGPENTAAVVEICRRLDGIPLAIELAAARVKVLAPGQIRDRLDDVFRLLSAGGRTAVPRHRTLRAAIDWSHDLLEEPARSLLRRLAIFRGGFGLEGAEQVGAGAGSSEADVLNLLASLVDRSLVGVREQQGATRYFLLEAVRQYATEQLVAAGEEMETRARHARHVLHLVEEAEPHFIRHERRIWVDRLQPDLDNIRSALGWSRDHDPALHVRLVGKLWWFWFSTQHWTEGGRWIDGALQLPAAAAAGPDRAALLFAAGALAALQVRTERARERLREAADLAAELGEGRLEAYATNYLGMTYAGEGREEALELCARAEAWFREHDDLYGLRLAALLQGSTHLGRGELDEAERLNREGVRVARLFGQDRELAVSLQNLAVVHLSQGRLDEAEALLREALAASRRDPSHYFIATGLSYVGEIEGRRGRPLAAARFLGVAEGVRERIGARAFRTDAARLEAHLPAFRAAAGEAAFEAAWAEGRSLRPERIIDELLAGDGAAAAAPGAPAAPASPASAGEPAGGAAAGAAGTAAAGAPTEASSVSASRAASGSAAASSPAAAPASADRPPARLRVDALGPLVVHVEGEPLPDSAWAYAKPKELLLFLLLHPGGAPRDPIGEALWPGAARSRTKNSFHVTLHHLRKTLGHPEWVVTDGDRYRLDPGLAYELDADRFEATARELVGRGRGAAGSTGAAGAAGAADAARGRDVPSLRAALALYRGELLEGELVGRWIDEHRDRLRRLYVQLGLALGEALEEADPAAAAELYQRLAAREELDEEIHRRLMSSWVRSGDRVRALRHYDRVVELLRDALDAEPEPETVALHERIRGGVPA